MQPSLISRFLLSLLILFTAWTLTVLTPMSNVSADQPAAVMSEN